MSFVTLTSYGNNPKVMYKAVVGIYFKRREQKRTGQLPIF
jgi:hypothetical protein